MAALCYEDKDFSSKRNRPKNYCKRCGLEIEILYVGLSRSGVEAAGGRDVDNPSGPEERAT
jgi:hypothetical protein